MCFEVMQHLPLAGLSSEDADEKRSPSGVERSAAYVMTLCFCVGSGLVFRMTAMLQHALQAP